MSEHQHTQHSKNQEPSSQRRSILTNQTHVSNPAAIIQRSRIDPKFLTSADVLQLQRTIGNRAVGRLLSEIRKPSFTVQQLPIQRQEIPEEEDLLQGIFESKHEEEKCPSCIQRQEIPEKEELLHGKISETIQQLEPEEEKVQIESVLQRQEIPEEPLQSMFEKDHAQSICEKSCVAIPATEPKIAISNSSASMVIQRVEEGLKKGTPVKSVKLDSSFDRKGTIVSENKTKRKYTVLFIDEIKYKEFSYEELELLETSSKLPKSQGISTVLVTPMESPKMNRPMPLSQLGFNSQSSSPSSTIAYTPLPPQPSLKRQGEEEHHSFSFQDPSMDTIPLKRREKNTQLPFSFQDLSTNTQPLNLPPNFLVSSERETKNETMWEEEYLKQLDDMEKVPHKEEQEFRKIKSAPSIQKPSITFKSTDIGQSNQECVLAAFATQIGTKDWTKNFEREMTSDDQGIIKVATALNLQPRSLSELRAHLKKGVKAFIRAPALYGDGWHAYCAFGVADNDYIIAYDPDTSETFDVKKIPSEKIDPNFIFF